MQPDAESGTGLTKTPTGISGFDSITFGGLPTGRSSLICGAAGCSKTLFALTFLTNGCVKYKETGVFVCFEERAEDLAANVQSLGYNLEGLVAAGRLAMDHIRFERSEIEQAGAFDLEGLFLRIGFAVDRVGAKRVVLDTLETLFAGFTDEALLRSELRRLFNWLKQRGLTTIITAERGDGRLTRQGLEEYVSDCVILLDNRVETQITTRRLRVVKYRGSAHGTNEYPFLIDEQGISVLPVTTLARLDRLASSDVVSTGSPGLDRMLDAGGFFSGSSVLLSGMAGTGKTTFGAHFADSACKRGERCMMFMFEESNDEICRNMASLGFNLRRRLSDGSLRINAVSPSRYGLETHLACMYRDIERFSPHTAVIDPISAFRGGSEEIHGALLRLVQLLKSRSITTVFTSTGTNLDQSHAELDLSSLMDVWIRLESREIDQEWSRTLRVVKARGMGHSNQTRRYRIGDAGIVVEHAGRSVHVAGLK